MSLCYKLNFTDGTFLTMIKYGTLDVCYRGEEKQFIIPNFYFGNIDGILISSTKYDYDGNKYVFTQNGVEINDGELYGDDLTRLIFMYDEDTQEVRVARVEPYYISLPQITLYQPDVKRIHAIVSQGDTTGTGYPTFGDLYLKGREFFNSGNGYYLFEDLTARTNLTPFCSTVIYVGNNVSDVSHELFESTYTRFYNPVPGLSVQNSIEEYDPEKPLEPDSDDPYDPAGNSGTGGGTGDFDGSSDDVDFPSLPSLSATDTGFITLFNPSISQLQSLASYMWGSLFDEGSFKKLFADPMNCILGLSIVPVNVPNGAAKVVKVGNISTNVSLTVAASQYVEVDCGTLNVNEFWGSYIDYAPYTKAEIYLPYIGTHALDVDDIMNKAVHVKYHVDVLSGACTAYVKCGDSIIYSFIGQCASSIPITGNDWTNVINGVMSIAGSIGTMVATGGATAPMAMQQIASTSVNSMKPTVEKSGALSGTGGLLGVQKPYIILTRPRQALPSAQNSFMGYPSFITEYLGSLSGYTEIESVHLDGIPANDAEINEIENLLKGGVIF